VLAEAMRKIIAETKVQFDAQEVRIKALEAEISTFKKSGKFTAAPKGGQGSEASGYKKLLK
jgi:hypothetical protein